MGIPATAKCASASALENRDVNKTSNRIHVELHSFQSFGISE